jgi:hypothetical protein
VLLKVVFLINAISFCREKIKKYYRFTSFKLQIMPNLTIKTTNCSLFFGVLWFGLARLLRATCFPKRKRDDFRNTLYAKNANQMNFYAKPCITPHPALQRNGK